MVACIPASVPLLAPLLLLLAVVGLAYLCYRRGYDRGARTVLDEVLRTQAQARLTTVVSIPPPPATGGGAAPDDAPEATLP